MRAISTLRRDDGMSTRLCRAIVALRMRASMSAIGSVISKPSINTCYVQCAMCKVRCQVPRARAGCPASSHEHVAHCTWHVARGTLHVGDASHQLLFVTPAM